MNIKKHVKVAVAIVVVLALIAGGIFAYQQVNNGKKTASVVPVSSLDMGYWGDSLTSYGTVTNDSSQTIYLADKQTVSEIYVEEGQTVTVGDPVISYDMQSTELAIEEKKLEIQKAENDITLAQSQLTKLKATTPISENTTQTQAPITEPIGEEKSGDAYCYLAINAQPYTGTGTAQDPYVYLCTSDAYMTAAFRNQMSTLQSVAIFEVRVDNSQSGELISSLTLNGMSINLVDDGTFWAVSNGEQIFLNDETTQPEEVTGYTQAELTQAITEKEQSLKNLDLQIRKAQLQLEQLQQTSEDGQVTATVSGIVEKVGDPENPPQDGTAFIVISASDGLYVIGQISELYLNQVQSGQSVEAMSWNSGSYFTATIMEVDDYPADTVTGYSDGNTNVSYYNYTAFIEDASGLENGENVELTLTLDGDTSGGVYIDKAYVRKEDGKSYVMKEDETSHLVKQYVTTGKTVWGSSIQILDGITGEDFIAFPYGKTAKEGIRCEETDSIY